MEPDCARAPGVPGRCVYVDARPFGCNRFTGIARYTARIALALAGHAAVRFFFDGEVAQAPADLDWSPDQDLARWARRIVRAPRRPLGTPPAGSVGLYPAIRPPARRFDREVSVLHDFSPLVLPWTHTAQTRAEYGEYFSRTILASDLALTASHSTKADAAWLSPMDPARIVVAPSGPSLCVETHLHRSPVRRDARIGLVVSTLEPRKNGPFLLEWFRSTAALPRDAELWWVGPLGWQTSRRELKAARGARRVRFLGNVPDAALCKLYQRAGWSVYPSLYEGFGFPVLDALRHGTPVLTAANSSLREFSGPGLYFFDPCDAATLDAAWAEFRSAGPGALSFPRASLDLQYSWGNVARILLDALDRLGTPARTRPVVRAA